MKKSWQTPFEIDPALLAHPDDPMRTQARLLSSHGHSDEKFSWTRAFFPTSVATQYRRAHTLFLLHFADLFLCHDFILAWGDRVANSLLEQKSRVLVRTVSHPNVRLRKRSLRCASLLTAPQPEFPQYLAIISRNFSAFCRSTADVVTA
jgi:hypothetical protein